MQNPVGYTFNATAHRAEMADFLALLTNPVATITFVRTIAAAFLTAGALVAGVAPWRLVRRGGALPDRAAGRFSLFAIGTLNGSKELLPRISNRHSS